MRAWKIVLPIVLIGLGGWFAEHIAGTLKPQSLIPTAKVRQSNLRLDVRTVGELQTTRSATLFAPPVGGASLQIVHLDTDGTVVKRGDVVLQFDPSGQEYNLETNRSEFEQAQQEIIKAKDQAAVQDSDDRLALLKAKYAVDEAKLQVQKNPLLAAIDAKKNLLALDEAQRTLTQLEQDIQSHSASNQALLQVAQAKYSKAQIEMQRAEQNIQNMTIRAPMAGVVRVRQNIRAIGGFFFSGMNIPEFRNGDQADPGTPIADILNMSGMEIMAKVSETDRPSVHVGEEVRIRVDAIPDQVFGGKVATIAGMAQKSIWEASPVGRFDLTVAFDHPGPRLRPGFTAHLTLIGKQTQGAIYVPRVAIFEADEKPVIYVDRNGKFVPRDVKIEAASSALAVIEGALPGEEVALVNPTSQSQTSLGPVTGPTVRGAQK